VEKIPPDAFGPELPEYDMRSLILPTQRRAMLQERRQPSEKQSSIHLEAIKYPSRGQNLIQASQNWTSHYYQIRPSPHQAFIMTTQSCTMTLVLAPKNRDYLTDSDIAVKRADDNFRRRYEEHPFFSTLTA